MLALVHPSAAHSSTRSRSRQKHPPSTSDTTPDPPTPPATTPPTPPPTALDIDTYPPQKLLKLLASLLTQIASTNDTLSPATSSSISSSFTSTLAFFENPIWVSLTTASRSALLTPSATLTFHARNIPTISLEAYLFRILKYCPTTNQVFLSLLVYFDRMSKLTTDATGRTFIIDSYNIHRLVIAGVTVASKFFSDVFYTNSRYAKVGGLPLTELNQLELQFLLLNDFRLVISSAEMRRYAEQLLVFSHSHSDYVSPMSLSIPPTSPPDQTSSVTPTCHTRPSQLPTAPPMISSAPHHQPTSHNPRSPSQAHEMRAMGAIDAYGGHLPGDLPKGYSMTREYHTPNHFHPNSNHDTTDTPFTTSGAGANQSVNRTPNARFLHRSDSNTSTGEDTETETENETGTETGTETDADADDTSTTDDEPTIRPGRASIAGSVYSVASASSGESGSSGERAANANGDGRMSRNEREESDVCSVRSFDTGDEGGDEYEYDEDMDDDVVPPPPSGSVSRSRTRSLSIPQQGPGINTGAATTSGRWTTADDDGERTPETGGESGRGGVKRPWTDTGSESVRNEGGRGSVRAHLDADWQGDTRMGSPRS
ncbi:hypothetical protein AX17_004970 [Amanita inopinata Kibby_2008]|nr:hypothetical protein AX17_004970 [Amanita inopinata Kibby_2008]